MNGLSAMTVILQAMLTTIAKFSVEILLFVAPLYFFIYYRIVLKIGQCT